MIVAERDPPMASTAPVRSSRVGDLRDVRHPRASTGHDARGADRERGGYGGHISSVTVEWEGEVDSATAERSPTHRRAASSLGEKTCLQIRVS